MHPRCGREIAFGTAAIRGHELLFARDTDFLVTSAYGTLNTDITECKRMLASLIQTVQPSSR